MKKFLVLILSIIMALCTVGLFACSEKEQSEVEKQVKAAYNSYVVYAEAHGEIPDTYEEWLKNIKGEKGDTGAQGEQGLQGETGNGIAGIEKTGTDGLVDTYTITFTDGTITTFTVTNGQDGKNGAQGEKGDQGEQGIQGQQGEKGEQGKSAYEIWLDNGFEGTEMDFLNWLRSGYAEEQSFSPYGTYKFYSVYMDGKTGYVGDNFNGIDIVDGLEILIFKPNGEIYYEANYSDETFIMMLTYVIQEDGYLVYYENHEYAYLTIDENTLICESVFDDSIVTFKKVSDEYIIPGEENPEETKYKDQVDDTTKNKIITAIDGLLRMYDYLEGNGTMKNNLHGDIEYQDVNNGKAVCYNNEDIFCYLAIIDEENCIMHIVDPYYENDYTPWNIQDDINNMLADCFVIWYEDIINYSKFYFTEKANEYACVINSKTFLVTLNNDGKAIKFATEDDSSYLSVESFGGVTVTFPKKFERILKQYLPEEPQNFNGTPYGTYEFYSFENGDEIFYVYDYMDGHETTEEYIVCVFQPEGKGIISIKLDNEEAAVIFSYVKEGDIYIATANNSDVVITIDNNTMVLTGNVLTGDNNKITLKKCSDSYDMPKDIKGQEA